MIFSNVIQFEEQVGRRQFSKYGELDQLTCIYTGPAYQALDFRPPVDSPHPQYPLMFVTGSEVANREALMAEVTVTYEGIIQTSGSSSYITPGIAAESPVQGSRDFVDLFIIPVGQPGLVYGPGGLGAVVEQLYNVTTRNVTVRYIGTQCAIRYQAYPRPTSLQYSHLGISRVQWQILSITYGSSSTAAAAVTGNTAQQVTSVNYGQVQGQLPTPTGIPPLYAANLGFEKQQRGKWYNCTEIYGPTF